MIRQLKENDEQISYVEKRAFNRIPVNIEARFFHGNLFYSGMLRNLSARGMLIDTKKCLPSNAMFVVIIREDNDLLNVIVKVKRASRKSDTCSVMGVELIRPSSGYRDFIHTL